MRVSKWVALITVILFSMSIIAGCGGGSGGTTPAGGEEIRIGLIAPLTGDVKTFGESVKNAFEMAMEEVDYKVGDFTIKVFIEDDRNMATEAVNVADKLITQNKVSAIVGSVTSSSTIPISEVAQANSVVLITPTATNPKVTVDAARKDFVFRACFIDPFQGTVAARFALTELNAKTAAVLYDQGNDYTIGLKDFFKESFVAGGGQMLAEEAYTKNDTDFSAVLTRIAQQKPDVLFLPDYYQKASLIGKQARDKGITATFVGGDGWDSPELDFVAMDGGYHTNHYSADDPRPEVQEWVAKYTAKHGQTPDALGTLAYDATKLLLKAIEDAGSTDPAAIRDAMKALNGFGVVSGSITFDENGNPIKSAAILQIKDGTQKFITIVNP
ncbi:MAG: ABC transporter substrate-binding protein [Eubacteriales bacterium]|nr:ABC transporter substrate-binding protein [Eubacteriales bacterium]MDZ7609382.1 ABC transporter substrate-binding protein [Eubacteriales bacterium]